MHMSTQTTHMHRATTHKHLCLDTLNFCFEEPRRHQATGAGCRQDDKRSGRNQSRQTTKLSASQTLATTCKAQAQEAWEETHQPVAAAVRKHELWSNSGRTSTPLTNEYSIMCVGRAEVGNHIHTCIPRHMRVAVQLAASWGIGATQSSTTKRPMGWVGGPRQTARLTPPTHGGRRQPHPAKGPMPNDPLWHRGATVQESNETRQKHNAKAERLATPPSNAKLRTISAGELSWATCAWHLLTPTCTPSRPKERCTRLGLHPQAPPSSAK